MHENGGVAFKMFASCGNMLRNAYSKLVVVSGKCRPMAVEGETRVERREMGDESARAKRT